jgi:GTP cyclohydrolase II/3,4-dihydroxy 2-butanone 4-phosphate synthase/GTP cyclohydrolase II
MKSCKIFRYAESNIPTIHGVLKMVVYHNNLNDNEDIAVINGNVSGAENVPVRIHSECITSEVFGSLKCDCRDQLNYALDYIAGVSRGVVVYLRQEGRGIGLGNKIRAYALQEQGLDTVEANVHLGFDDDLRDYCIAVQILKDLEIESIELFTNNPKKIAGLEEGGIKIARRKPIQMTPTAYNAEYLITKARRSGHYIDIDLVKRKENKIA